MTKIYQLLRWSIESVYCFNVYFTGTLSPSIFNSLYILTSNLYSMCPFFSYPLNVLLAVFMWPSAWIFYYKVDVIREMLGSNLKRWRYIKGLVMKKKMVKLNWYIWDSEEDKLNMDGENACIFELYVLFIGILYI